MKNRAVLHGWKAVPLLVLAFVLLCLGGCGRGDGTPLASPAAIAPKEPDDGNGVGITQNAYVFAEKNSSPVQNLRAQQGDANITLSWDVVAEVDGYPVEGYVIYRSQDETGDFVASAETVENSKTYYHLTNDQEYQFKVAVRYIENGQETISESTNAVAAVPRNSGIVRVSSAFLSLKTGEQEQLRASRFGKEIAMAWHSQNEAVATVDDEGRVTAQGAGYCDILGTDGNHEVRATIAVDKKPNWIDVAEEPRYVLGEGTQWYQAPQETDAQREEGHVRLSFVGDLISTNRQQDAAKAADGAYDFSRSFQYVADILSTRDFVMGNLEMAVSYSFPYASELRNYMNSENSNAPVEFIAALRQAGIDAVATANDQSADAGPAGIVETLQALEHYQLIATGTFQSKEERRYQLVTIGGIKCAILSTNQKIGGSRESLFTDDELTFMMNPPYRKNLTRDIQNAKADGAEFVIVYNHGGGSGSVSQSDSQLSWTTFLAEAGADLIVGAHPRVLQRVGVVYTKDGREVPIAYSLGNFVSSMTDFENACTVIFQVELMRDENGKAKIKGYEYIPCYTFAEVGRDAYVVVPALPENKHLFGDVLYQRVTEYIDRVMQLGT